MNPKRCPSRYTRTAAFTLIELLVVIAIIAMLLAILTPVLRSARQQGRTVVCIANLRQIGVAIIAYAAEHNDHIPLGPEGLPPPNFYNVTGNVTSLICLSNRKPVGLGLLLDKYLADQPEVLFCPGSDQPTDAGVQLGRFGKYETESVYYFRHGSLAAMTGTP